MEDQHADVRDTMVPPSGVRGIPAKNTAINIPKNLKYIDNELQNPEVDKKRLFYGYIDFMLPFHPDDYAISRRDWYRVVKHSLLERDAEVLPETLDDIPIPIKRDHYDFKSHQSGDGDYFSPLSRSAK